MACFSFYVPDGEENEVLTVIGFTPGLKAFDKDTGEIIL